MAFEKLASSTQTSFHKTAYVSIVRKCTCLKERKLFPVTRKKTLVSANVGAYFLLYFQHVSPPLDSSCPVRHLSFPALAFPDTNRFCSELDWIHNSMGRDSSIGADSPRSGDRIPVGGEIFHTRPDRPWGPPSALYNGYWVSLPAVQRPRRGADHPTPFSAEGKERIELYINSQSEPSRPVQGWTLPMRTLSSTQQFLSNRGVSYGKTLLLARIGQRQSGSAGKIPEEHLILH